LRQRRGAGLGELQQARGRSKYFATAPAHTQRALHGAQNSRGWSGKMTSFSCSGYTRACHRHFLFLVPKCHTEFFTFIRSSPPFSPACSPPPGCFFARDCAHAGGPVR
jgi:hypothetical protein